jgi:hypothetical protein
LQEIAIVLWGNIDEVPVYFIVPTNYTIDDAGAKSVVIKSSGNE